MLIAIKHPLRYCPVTAAKLAQGSLPFALLGRTGGYGRTRAALVAAVQRGDHTTASVQFNQLIREGIEDDFVEGIAPTVAVNALMRCIQDDPEYRGFIA